MAPSRPQPSQGSVDSSAFADQDLTDAHVQHTVDLLLDRSRVLADQVAAGHTGVVGLGLPTRRGRLPDGHLPRRLRYGSLHRAD
ncbi:hypothetical protein ACIQNG_33920 [Streptomyces sp. NPDC091377]|uniref:hypothetical protein n=1 Tax=Streptomyces sp. NPDC091377 TaxID=3365995 RepID=UPI003809A27C